MLAALGAIEQRSVAVHESARGDSRVLRTRRRRRSSTYPDSALAAADELLARGSAPEAIQLLTEANRARRHWRVEQRLVALRYEAFRQTSPPEDRPSWPEGVEDRFPDQLVPEVAAADLTAEDIRSGIRNHGSLLVRELVGREDVGRLVADIDTAFDAFDAEASREKRSDLVGWYERFQPDRVSDRTRRRSQGNLTAAESPPTLFDLIETLERVGMGQRAREYFGEPPMLLARKTTLRRLPHNGSGGWHQDGAFMGAGIRSLNVWMALSHCGDDAPGLDVVGRRFDDLVQTGDPASPKVGSGYADWGVSPENAEKAADGAIVRPIFEAGDALVFDQLCLHRTGRDPGMTKGRYAIETWLFAPSTYAAMTTPSKAGYSPRDQLPIYF